LTHTAGKKQEFSTMKTSSFRSLMALLFLALSRAAVAGDQSAGELEKQITAKFLPRLADRQISPPEIGILTHECRINAMSCNTTISDGLFAGGCETDDGDYFDVYSVFLTQGTQIVVRVNAPGGLDPAVFITDEAASSVLASDDDSGGGLNALLSYTVPISRTYLIVVFSVIGGDFGFYTLMLTCTAGTAPPPGNNCVSNASTMCLNNNRFKLQLQWRAPNGTTGVGNLAPYSTADSGLFWFFNAANLEMLVKVLNGCSINNHYWVFAAATTNVEYTLTVTDMKTGLTKQYFNHQGVAAPALTDTTAFQTCP
jgi:hypothetical protein